MKIVGKGAKVLDADLLAKMAIDRQSGATVSKAEAKATIADIKNELSDEFVSSTRGLARSEKAIANTLALALRSGWVRGGSASEMIKDFIQSSEEGSLSDTVKDVRKEVRSNRASRGSSYGGYSRTYTRSYGS